MYAQIEKNINQVSNSAVHTKNIRFSVVGKQPMNKQDSQLQKLTDVHFAYKSMKAIINEKNVPQVMNKGKRPQVHQLQSIVEAHKNGQRLTIAGETHNNQPDLVADQLYNEAGSVTIKQEYDGILDLFANVNNQTLRYWEDPVYKGLSSFLWAMNDIENLDTQVRANANVGQLRGSANANAQGGAGWTGPANHDTEKGNPGTARRALTDSFVLRAPDWLQRISDLGKIIEARLQHDALDVVDLQTHEQEHRKLITDLTKEMQQTLALRNADGGLFGINDVQSVNTLLGNLTRIRDEAMLKRVSGIQAAKGRKHAVFKAGEDHIEGIKAMAFKLGLGDNVHVMTRNEYLTESSNHKLNKAVSYWL
ncbi:hypothetical protein [Shewanella surugensis]|uniref:Uncharacterized protein n=1 Tax=Shewanella surugensis TaxID=212020 RepID=A0ABT0LEI4_9GAMM|nr:hypothetical protein [Shewanella surugensis]MCL1126112.1 hypothetical protein [Shewanella surugensis]